MWTAAVFLVGNHLAALPRPSAPISENLAPECAAAQSQLQWPQFHVLNRVTPGTLGSLKTSCQIVMPPFGCRESTKGGSFE
eukprot:m.165725 g.165725  ORF g.165725 m.165725 type:complete len:81 (-) comp14685_c0_seq1:1752-1994(-)